LEAAVHGDSLRIQSEQVSSILASWDTAANAANAAISCISLACDAFVVPCSPEDVSPPLRKRVLSATAPIAHYVTALRGGNPPHVTCAASSTNQAFGLHRVYSAPDALQPVQVSSVASERRVPKMIPAPRVTDLSFLMDFSTNIVRTVQLIEPWAEITTGNQPAMSTQIRSLRDAGKRATVVMQNQRRVAIAGQSIAQIVIRSGSQTLESSSELMHLIEEGISATASDRDIIRETVEDVTVILGVLRSLPDKTVRHSKKSKSLPAVWITSNSTGNKLVKAGAERRGKSTRNSGIATKEATIAVCLQVIECLQSAGLQAMASLQWWNSLPKWVMPGTSSLINLGNSFEHVQQDFKRFFDSLDLPR